MGKNAKNVSESDAISHVAGYCIGNARHITLRAGDIIFTGTPEGVILGYPKDKHVWLKAGDKIACSVEKLGELRFGLV